MTTLNVTIPTKKAGKLAVFTIQFDIANFEKVVDAAASLKSIEELNSCTLWKVI